MSDFDQCWTAPDGVRIPDFMICGAMKSGTSTLHYILNQHPDIFIPEHEVSFFDIDNMFQHPDYNFFQNQDWLTQDITTDPDKFWNWYASHFAKAKDNQKIGEHSAAYIASEAVAQRVKLQKKPIKLIVILRNPTTRAYSQYWHFVRANRAMYSFEETLLNDPYSVLNRSMYKDQLQRFYDHLPKEQVKVIIFEEFLSNKETILQEVCDFIDIDYGLLPKNAIEAHKHPTHIPKFPAIQLLKNRLFRGGGNQLYRSRLPLIPSQENLSGSNLHKLINIAHRKINPLVTTKPPKIKKTTRQFLDNYFIKEFQGLNEMLGKDVLSMWFK